MAELRVAKSAGFCYGVERAVKLAEETAREKGGCAMLGMDVKDVAAICIEGMRPYAQELGLDGAGNA